MRLEFIQYFDETLSTKSEPSERDLQLNLFSSAIEVKKHLPVKFYIGKSFEVRYDCLNCSGSVILRNEASTFSPGVVDIGELSSSRYNPTFLDSLIHILPELSVKQYDDFWALVLTGGGFANLLYVKCPYCEEQYLLTYNIIRGKWPERGLSATPDEFYIENIVWVKFDESELFKA